MKKIILPLILTIVIFTLIFSSCKPSFDKQINQLDSTISLIETDSINLSKFTLEVVQAKYNDYKIINKKLDSLYDFNKKDSNWMLLTNFKDIEKPLRKHTNRYKKIVEDYSFLHNQLITLKKDLIEKNINKKEAESYLKIETEDANRFHFGAEKYYKLMTIEFAKFDTLSPKVNLLIQQINSSPKKSYKKKK